MDLESEADGEPNAAVPMGVSVFLSAIVVIHFGLILINILGEPSGPWPAIGGEGVGLAQPPSFLSESMAETAHDYALGVRLGETGRFPSNRLQPLQVHLEAVLYDDQGNEVGTRLLPDPKALPWNRAREQLLAQVLANDIMKPNPGPESIAPPGQEPPKTTVWRAASPTDPVQHLTQVPLHLLRRPPDPPDFGPSDWGLELSKSYAVHLCRTAGAASVEIRRKWRMQPAPFMITGESRPVGPRDLEQIGERVSTYGKVSDADQRRPVSQ